MVAVSRGWGSSVVPAGVALVATCYGFARFGYGLFVSRFSDEFGLSAGLLGVIGGVGYIGYCLAIISSTVLTSRWGPRPVAVLAGAVATVGMAVVAAAPSALVLTAGVLVAGSSTGVASPPLAAAVARNVRPSARDTAQTVVNAGTGVGVLASGPVALLLSDRWRLAWALFAVVAALVTVWAARVTPSGAEPVVNGPGHARQSTGSWSLLTASFVLGLASIGVWTFGQDLVRESGGPQWLPSVGWMVIGAAGIAGAFSGAAVDRLGIRTSWVVLTALLALGSAGLAFTAGSVAGVLVAGAVFGAAYIALTGVILVWATRIYPSRPSFGVGLAFLLVAAGQGVGAPVAGLVADTMSLQSVLLGCALIAIAASAIPAPGQRESSRP